MDQEGRRSFSHWNAHHFHFGTKLKLSSLCGPCGSKEGRSVEKEVTFWEKLVSRHHHGKGTGKGNSTAQAVQVREDRVYLGHELLEAKEHFFLWPNDSL